MITKPMLAGKCEDIKSLHYPVLATLGQMLPEAKHGSTPFEVRAELFHRIGKARRLARNYKAKRPTLLAIATQFQWEWLRKFAIRF